MIDLAAVLAMVPGDSVLASNDEAAVVRTASRATLAIECSAGLQCVAQFAEPDAYIDAPGDDAPDADFVARFLATLDGDVARGLPDGSLAKAFAYLETDLGLRLAFRAARIGDVRVRYRRDDGGMVDLAWSQIDSSLGVTVARVGLANEPVELFTASGPAPGVELLAASFETMPPGETDSAAWVRSRAHALRASLAAALSSPDA